MTPIPQPSVLVIETSPGAALGSVQALRAAGFRVTAAHTGRDILAAVYADPPQCLVVPHGLPGSAGMTLLDELKSDNVYGHLPMLLSLPASMSETIDWSRVPADDYVVEPVSNDTLVSRVRLCLARAQRDFNANPLTGLPGNVTIMREAERRIAAGQSFALGYLDLDNFKPFNDRYGFSRGDEVLRMTARVLVNAIRNLGSPETYVGHIGGDDFVFITPPSLVDKACKDTIRDFDLIIPSFYDEEDRVQRGIQSLDRKRNVQTFPFMTCSIAVVDSSTSDIHHLAEVSARSAELKKLAKSLPGSNYIIDRRK